MRILFVCDGNICRSPMAEALLRQRLAEKKVDEMQVTSSGLVASPWGVAHSQLRRVLGPTYGLVEGRHSRPLTRELVSTSDLILGMEDRHVSQILERFPDAEGRVFKITSYAGVDGEIKDFPDSRYGDVYGWLRDCHSKMVPCIDAIAEKIVLGNRSVPHQPGKLD
jgi:protein-tyrosine-phosphatase